MANKKISQLTSMGTVGIGTDDYFVTAESLGAGNYATVKSTALQVSEYVLNPIAATQISGEDKDVYFDNNDNWDTASNTVTQNPYLQVRVSDGKLVTGSGIANAVGGDNMGNCQATQDIDMQGHDITSLGNIGFQGAADSKLLNITAQDDVRLQAGRDLVVSGNRNILLKAQGIDASLTPFIGEVRVTGGNLDIDPDYKLIVNEIQAVQGSASNDDASISINGASRSVPAQYNVAESNYTTINWRDSNVQYGTVSNASPTAFNVDFFNTALSTWDTNLSDGQTLTFYLKNNTSSSLSPTFRLDGAAGDVEWGDQYFPNGPPLYDSKTTIYTFIKIGAKVFGSAITGYAI